MCWSTTHYYSQAHVDGDTDPFTITSFFVRLRTSSLQSNAYSSAPPASKPTPLPESLTLILCFPLDSNSRNKVPFLSLRRMRQTTTEACVTFGSMQRVRATTQTLSFQLYVGETELLKGVIRKNHNDWKLECCKCELQSCLGISEVELFVALDGVVAIRERVVMPVVKTRNGKYNTRWSNKLLKLEDIPEETELQSDDDDDVDVNTEVEEACVNLEMDLEVLRRAMDMGIWVLCLGMGYMVSRASIPNIRPPRRFFDLYHFLS
ncbi:hypothetical protein VNO77_44809 [Canavalia gladiata]|uniref:Uncharacterized protein n=1 Tax=Canavalia gladiata TaxID=3824 RepID=A0AAN9K0B9_CANGL